MGYLAHVERAVVVARTPAELPFLPPARRGVGNCLWTVDGDVGSREQVRNQDLNLSQHCLRRPD